MRSQLFCAVVLFLLLSLGLAAQDDTGADSTPTAASNVAATAAESDAQDTGATGAIANNPPLTSVDAPALETSTHSRKYLTPSIGISQSMIDNQSGNQNTNNGTEGLSRAFGTLSLERTSGRYDFTAGYVGAALYNSRDTHQNGQVHQLSLQEKITGERSQLQFMDLASYSPDSNFGSQALGGVGAFQSIVGGTLGGGLNTGFNILNPNFAGTGLSNRVSNMAVIQGEHALSRQTTLTAAVSYGLLRFIDGGGVSSRQGGIALGYNYSLSRHQTLALLYTGAAFRFKGVGGSFNTQSLYAVYGAHLSSRLNMKIGAGPQVIASNQFGTGTTDQVSWGGLASAEYSFRRTVIRVRLERFINNGSGIFLGARSNYARLDFDRKLTRGWDGSMNFGFAHSNRLQSVPVNTDVNATGLLPLPLQSNSRVANMGYAGVRLAHKWGQNAGIFVTYQFGRQTSDSPICTTISGCQRITQQHEGGIGFNWHGRSWRTE